VGFRVTIEPSGHQFENESGETLLESALRSGLPIAYHCSSGSCGECYGRLIKGELGERQTHDFRLSQQQQSEGGFLLCRNHAASDLVISAHELNDPATIPLQHIETKVYKLTPANEEYLILQLRTPRSSTLQFLAGQTVKLTIPGLESYLIAVASCPCNGMFLQFHINRNHPHPFVRRLVKQGREVGRVIVEGPYGKRSLLVQHERPLIFIAKDSEFGAIKSLIEQVINLELTQPVRLFWIASDDKQHYMENYCRSWREQLDNYRFQGFIQEESSSIERMLTYIAEKLDGEDESYIQSDTYIAAPFNDLYRIQAWWQAHYAAHTVILMTENRERDAVKSNL
jgi:CDP-4-dehydro-6-deoxyglucose reductase